MTCATCIHFETSAKANQRAVLEGFGYCKAAPSPETRARFFRGDTADCWLTASAYRPDRVRHE